MESSTADALLQLGVAATGDLMNDSSSASGLGGVQFDADYEDPLPEPGLSSEFWFRAVCTVVYSSLAVLGFAANLLFFLWRNEQLHSVTHMLMRNLALCNLLFLVFHPPYFVTTYILQSNWPFGLSLCKASYSVVYVTATGSFYFMTLVAVDRWLAVFARTKRHRIGRTLSVILSACVWCIALLVAAPFVYKADVIMDDFWKDLVSIDDGYIPPFVQVQCGIECQSGDECRKPLQTFSTVAIYAIPLGIMVPIYMHLSYFFYRRTPVGFQSAEKFRRSQSRKRRLLLTLLAIVFSLILCWSPLFVVGLIHAYTDFKIDMLTEIALCGILLTPILYLCNDGRRVVVGVRRRRQQQQQQQQLQQQAGTGRSSSRNQDEALWLRVFCWLARGDERTMNSSRTGDDGMTSAMNGKRTGGCFADDNSRSFFDAPSCAAAADGASTQQQQQQQQRLVPSPTAASAAPLAAERCQQAAAPLLLPSPPQLHSVC